MDISLYGGTGFIGKSFYDRYKALDNISLVPRYSRRPQPNTEILYLISTTHNYNVFDDTTLDVNTNLVVLTEALESWRKNNPQGTFNFLSSWFVYGDVPMPVNEFSNCNPKGFYSITKRCAEQLVISYAETFNLKYRILRLGNVLGKNDLSVSSKKNALQYLINQMKANVASIPVYEQGLFTRNYIDIDDCIKAIVFVMLRGQTNSIYNIATDQAYLFIDMLNYAKQALQSPTIFEFVDQAEFHKKIQTKSFNMRTKKLYDLGFQHSYDMEQMIDRLL